MTRTELLYEIKMAERLQPTVKNTQKIKRLRQELFLLNTKNLK